MKSIRAEPLTVGAFAPFGIVCDWRTLPGRPVNEGRGERCDWPVAPGHAAAATSPATAVYRIAPSVLPYTITLMERHPGSEQLFIPLTDNAFLVAVSPDPASVPCRAFIGRAGQAVLYRAGLWHLPLVALDTAGAFLMQMWETGDPAQDCETRSVPPLIVSPAAAG